MAKEKTENTVENIFHIQKRVAETGYTGIIGSGSEQINVMILPEELRSAGGVSVLVSPMKVYINDELTDKPYFVNLTFTQQRSLVVANIIRLTQEQGFEYNRMMSEFLKNANPDTNKWAY